MMSTKWHSGYPQRKRTVIVAAAFLIFALTGLFIFDDYGISWDESRQRYTGYISAVYVLDQWRGLAGSRTERSAAEAALLARDRHKHYGVAIEMPLYAAEVLLGLTDLRDVYLMRHLVTFCLFFIGVVFFYLVVLKRFGDWRLGLLGCLFLVMSPRTFAHSFYNSKDLVFMALFIVNIYTLLVFVESRSLFAAFIHGLAGAILIGTRVVGIFIPAVTVVFCLASLLQKPAKTRQSRTLRLPLAIYLFTAAVFTVLMWPFLWSDVMGSIADAFSAMSQFSRTSVNRYMGEFIDITKVPWHYIPVWIGITTPIPYLILFGVGAAALLYRFISSPAESIRSPALQVDALFFGMAVLPIVAVVVLGSTLYDGWRHMFFVYPGILLIAIKGLHVLLALPARWQVKRIMSISLAVALFASFATTLVFMVRNHPHQNVYFNMLAEETDFDLDYWGLSYRQALEYLAYADKSRRIPYTASNAPGEMNRMMLRAEDRKRLKWVPLHKAKYFLSNYRYPAAWNRYQQRAFPYSREIYNITVDGTPILGIYQLRD